MLPDGRLQIRFWQPARLRRWGCILSSILSADNWFAGRRPASTYDFHSIRIVGSDAVLIQEAGNGFGVVRGAMAGVARHLELSAEIGLIDHFAP